MQRLITPLLFGSILLVGCTNHLDLVLVNQTGRKINVTVMPGGKHPELAPGKAELTLDVNGQGRLRVLPGDKLIRIDRVPQSQRFRRERRYYLGEDGRLTLTASRFTFRGVSEDED